MTLPLASVVSVLSPPTLSLTFTDIPTTGLVSLSVTVTVVLSLWSITVPSGSVTVIFPSATETTAFSILSLVSVETLTLYKLPSLSSTCALPLPSVISVSVTGTTAIPSLFVISDAVASVLSVTLIIIPFTGVLSFSFMTLI